MACAAISEPQLSEMSLSIGFDSFEHSAGHCSSRSTSPSVASTTSSRALDEEAEPWSPAAGLRVPGAEDDGLPKLERQCARLACDLLASYDGLQGAEDHNAVVPALGAPALERQRARLACDMPEMQRASVSPASQDDAGLPKLERQCARLACDLLASYDGLKRAEDHNAVVPALGAPALERQCARLACDMPEMQRASVSPASQDDAGLPKLERQCARLVCEQPPVAPRYSEEDPPCLKRQRASLAHELPALLLDPVVEASQEDRYPKLERQYARLACDVPAFASCRGSALEDGFPTLERQFARLACDLPLHA